MEEKVFHPGPARIVPPDNHHTTMPNQRLSSRKFLMALLSVVLPVYLIFSLLSRAFPAGLPKPTSVSMTASNRSLVPLEAHIMSKCPDARDCLRNLVVPAMEQVVNKVNFTLSFIGSYDIHPLVF